MSGIAVVMLAAGSSSRLGRPKQLLPLAGEPLIAHVAHMANSVGAERVLVVVGAYAAQVEDALDDTVEEVITNPRFAEGMGTSIAAAVRYLDATSALLGDIEAVVFVLADQPGVAAAQVTEAIDRWRNGAGIVATRYRGMPGHPVLFDRAYWRELAALAGDEGGRVVIAAHPDAVEIVEVDAPAPLDVDTDADWRRLQEMWPT